MVLFMTRHPIPDFPRFCQKNEFTVGRLRFAVSRPFAKSANGWGTTRLWRFGNRRIGVPGQVLRFSVVPAVWGLMLCAAARAAIAAEPTPAAVAAFNSYAGAIESRLAQQHRSQDRFLVLPAAGSQNELQLRGGELMVEKLTPPANTELSGALLHHWRGTAFAAGARAADFERLIRDFNGYPQYFSPQVVQARVLAQQGDRMQAVMRVRQHHVITVVMDATYDIGFERVDARRGYSLSRSTRISEIEAAGTADEHAMNGNDEHGFLWRLNTYWSYEERDGGLYLQIESVSLTRSIPRGLGWAVGPFVESVPRESLEFTLRSACKALRK
jgi:hypothetical protein